MDNSQSQRSGTSQSLPVQNRHLIESRGSGSNHGTMNAASRMMPQSVPVQNRHLIDHQYNINRGQTNRNFEAPGNEDSPAPSDISALYGGGLIGCECDRVPLPNSYNKLTGKDCADMVSDAVKSILKDSCNVSFRQEVYRMLGQGENTDSDDVMINFRGKLEEILRLKYGEDEEDLENEENNEVRGEKEDDDIVLLAVYNTQNTQTG